MYEFARVAIVGYNHCCWGYCAEIADSYWDIEASGEPNKCGTEEYGTAQCDNSYGKTTAKMKEQSTFEGWDFIDETANGTGDIWWILEGQDYLRLWWEKTGN